MNRTIFDKPVIQEPVSNKEQPPKPEPISVVKPKLQIKVRAPVEEELTGMKSDDEFKESEQEYEESEEILNESSFDSAEDEMIPRITPQHKSTKRSRFVESSDDEFSFSPDTDSASKRKK